MLSVYDEGAMTEIRKGMSVERGIEEALRDFAGQGAASSNGIAVTEITADERIDRIGNLSALAILEASENTAKDIEEAGQAAVSIANDIMKEAQQLAADLRANGKKMSEHLKEFARLSNKVSAAMRNTRAEVLNGEDPLPRAAMLPPPMRDGETIQ
jgi:vacuolar-type H+-ATPase subunit H